MIANLLIYRGCLIGRVQIEELFVRRYRGFFRFSQRIHELFRRADAKPGTLHQSQSLAPDHSCARSDPRPNPESAPAAAMIHGLKAAGLQPGPPHPAAEERDPMHRLTAVVSIIAATWGTQRMRSAIARRRCSPHVSGRAPAARRAAITAVRASAAARGLFAADAARGTPARPRLPLGAGPARRPPPGARRAAHSRHRRPTPEWTRQCKAHPS